MYDVKVNEGIMKTLDELSYYCKQDNPVGALLLKGEWGSGKTYLIEKTLKAELKNTHFIIRISLFGIASIDELHHAVKSGWIDQVGGVEAGKKNLSRIFRFLDKFKDAVPDGSWRGVAGGLLSIDFTSFVKVKNVYDEKKVILVFDDLERSSLNPVEILGAINEYCENQGFNVIIIADEERLKIDNQNQASDNMKRLLFEDIKEKVIQRTVYLIPDYKQIIDNVIENTNNPKYKEFLTDNKEAIKTLISGLSVNGNDLDNEVKGVSKRISFYHGNGGQSEKEEKARQLIKNRPHNIRSLKAAIQDFQRIFTILRHYHVADVNGWFLSFVSFSLAARANLIDKDEDYGYLFCNENMDLLYPGYYDSRYFPDSLAKWVMEGRWEEEELNEYIELHYPTEKDTPASLVRSTRIDWLDESVVDEGIVSVAQEAYKGQLTYNQYVLFIVNNKIAREYGLIIPKVKWDIVQKAIKEKIEADINSERETWEEKYHETIGEGQLVDYSEDEQNTYQIIKDVRNHNTIILEKNRRAFIKEMKCNPELALISMQNKRYRSYDQEMAEATIEGYKNAENTIKARFPESFKNAWSGYKHSFDVAQDDINVTMAAFKWLENELKEVLKGYKDKPFKHRFTEAFIKNVHSLYHENLDHAE